MLRLAFTVEGFRGLQFLLAPAWFFYRRGAEEERTLFHEHNKSREPNTP